MKSDLQEKTAFSFPSKKHRVFIASEILQVLLNMQQAVKSEIRHFYQSSSRLARWKHMTVQTKMKNDVNSMNIAPVSIISACLSMMGMAILPTAEAPVINLAASIQPPPSRLIRNCVEPPPKNKQGIGTITYMRAESIGHQLLYIAQARICSSILAENMKASPASTAEDAIQLTNPMAAMHKNINLLD